MKVSAQATDPIELHDLIALVKENVGHGKSILKLWCMVDITIVNGYEWGL